jgi:hypothetical protein
MKSKTMKSIFTLLVGVSFSLLAVAQSGQDIQRYSYEVWGTVVDEKSRSLSHLTVCFLPAERPINGRIPCTKTGDSGSFWMTVKDIPDKYIVCASTTDSPFISAQDKDPTHRVTCSKPIEFGAHDQRREVNLKFEKKERQP